MSIEHLFRSTAFDPETIEVMLAAYDRTRKALRLTERDDCAAWVVAAKIVEQVWLGKREPDQMCRQVLKELGRLGGSPFCELGHRQTKRIGRTRNDRRKNGQAGLGATPDP
jgi:hypothetical protein